MSGQPCSRGLLHRQPPSGHAQPSEEGCSRGPALQSISQGPSPPPPESMVQLTSTYVLSLHNHPMSIAISMLHFARCRCAWRRASGVAAAGSVTPPCSKPAVLWLLEENQGFVGCAHPARGRIMCLPRREERKLLACTMLKHANRSAARTSFGRQVQARSHSTGIGFIDLARSHSLATSTLRQGSLARFLIVFIRERG